jgi:hypothetical protein
VATDGKLRLAPGQATATVAVPVIGNTLLQSDRTFGVVASDPLFQPNPLVSAAFAPQQTFRSGSRPRSVALADVNSKNRCDFALNLVPRAHTLKGSTACSPIAGPAW